MDATGAYRVRAHALGGGNINDKANDCNKKVNEKLCDYEFLSLSSIEGLQILKDIIMSSSSDSKSRNMECAIVDCKNGRLIRM